MGNEDTMLINASYIRGPKYPPFPPIPVQSSRVQSSPAQHSTPSTDDRIPAKKIHWNDSLTEKLTVSLHASLAPRRQPVKTTPPETTKQHEREREREKKHT
jgi:hypothetical protein